MYQLTASTNVLRIADGAEIPADETSPDYQRYLAWVDAGNTAEAYVEPPAVVPSVVTRRQARRALLDAGLLASVDAAIAAMSSPAKERAQIDWDDAQTFERDNALLAQLASALSLDDAALDALFTAAGAL